MSASEADATILDGRFAVGGNSVGEGGHARLYKAYDLKLQSHAAVKLFKPSRPVDDRTLRLAWSNELDAYVRLGEHPNLLALLGYGSSQEDSQWLAFEWCGEDLETFVRKTPMSWETLRPIAYEILTGLSLLHGRNFIHRDLKPRNVLIDDGIVKIADFGTIRLREVTSIGMTMNQLGTKPYAPPESGTLDPTPSYDVYSFAVLVVACLTGDFEMEQSAPEHLLPQLECPKEVQDILARSLADSPEDRPSSASVLLAELRQLEKKLRPADASVEVGLEITAAALRSFGEALTAETPDLNEVARELGSRVRVMLDPKEAAGQDLLLIGRSVVAVAAVHSSRAGFLVIKHVWKPRVAQIERLRRQSESFAVRWSPVIMRPQEATIFLDSVFRKIREKHDEIRERRASRSEVHDRWERVLNAKFTLARDRGRDIAYSSFRTEGARIYLSVNAEQPEPELGELRIIRTTTGRFLRAEVESIEDSEIGLYVNEGSVADLPRRGTLSIDSDRTRSKLMREQAALRRVFEGGAARPDLKDILNNPALNPEPEKIELDSYFQENLDDAKRRALSTVVGSTGMSIVQGPPGTGKTTLIAELIAQQLARDPDSRILLAAQTHIALDHALSKVMSISPEASVLRVGNPDQLAQADEAWTIPAQLAAWKKETQVACAGYMRRYLAATNSTDIGTRELATRFKALIDRAEKTKKALSANQEELDVATSRRDVIQAKINLLIETVAELESNAPIRSTRAISDSIQELVDRTLNFSAEIMTSDAELGKIDDLLVEVAEQTSLSTELEQEMELLTAELYPLTGLAADTSDEQLLAKVEELLSEDDKRAQAIQTLADEWIERFRPTAEFRLALLFRARIVASTCVALTGSQGADRVVFDLCIIDEASKANPTELMVPLASSRKWVLVGDEKQLPPFIEPELQDSEFLDGHDLQRSEVEERLFAELVTALPSTSVSSLTQQHRMHPSIGDLVSRIFYGGRLASSPREDSDLMRRAVGGNLVWRDRRRRSSERRVGVSFSNREEARDVLEVLKALESEANSLGMDCVEVAVITGYAAQVRTLQEVLGSSRSSLKRLRVRVATIDSFQGQEADICLVSMTRDNQKGEVGFLASPERLNVAISRARDGLVIVGSRDTALRARRRAPALAEIAGSIDVQGGSR